MSTHVPGFQSFSRLFASFCTGKISHQQQVNGQGIGMTFLTRGVSPAYKQTILMIEK